MAETAYCVKCRAKQEVKDAQVVTMKNGRSALKGKCSVCGTGLYKILAGGTNAVVTTPGPSTY